MISGANRATGEAWFLGSLFRFGEQRNQFFNYQPTLDDPPKEAEMREVKVFSIGEKGEEIIDAEHHDHENRD